MNTLQKIRQGFAYFRTSNLASITLKESYYWLVKLDGMQGVAIGVPKDKLVNEQFANIKYYTKSYLIDGEEHHLLMFVSNLEDLFDDFALLCASFLEKINDAEIYQEIQDNPIVWWHIMKKLIGNANVEKEAYSLLGEMLGYYYVKSFSKDVVWKGPFGATIDIESINKTYEVKSTISRYGKEITVNSQYQLNGDHLLFFRFEPAINGLSIQDMVEKLVLQGEERENLEIILNMLKFVKGSEIRLRKYALLEALKYRVDEKFPKITLESFKNDMLPQHIKAISYVIDLEGIESEAISLDSF